MNRWMRGARQLSLLTLAVAMGVGSALAEKPDWAGGGKGRGDGPPGQMKKMERTERTDRDERRWDRDDHRGDQGKHRDRRDARAHRPVVVVQPGGYFTDGQRRYAQQWYGEQYRAGRCPPGLAKKHNGCMPPGQAKKWRMGYAVPAGVVYYPVPQPVMVQLGAPPAGYRYVRVADDILLMAIGSRMVVDAIGNLGRAF